MKEKELFTLIKEKLCPSLEPTEQYDYKDAYCPGLKMVIELKCRNDNYPTMLIEKPKYDKLVTVPYKARYICSTPTQIISFNVKTISTPWWQFQWLPATTEFGRTKLVEKVVGYIPNDKGKDITGLLLD